MPFVACCAQGRLFEYTNVEPGAEVAAFARSLLDKHRAIIHRSTGKWRLESVFDWLDSHSVANVVEEITWAAFCQRHKAVNKTHEALHFDLVLMVHSIYFLGQGISSS